MPICTVCGIGSGERIGECHTCVGKRNGTIPTKRGIYETEYGNAAYVSGPRAKSAFDLDSAERIPISAVTTKWLRKAEPSDAPSYRHLD